jgi:hypothetical protein
MTLWFFIKLHPNQPKLTVRTTELRVNLEKQCTYEGSHLHWFPLILVAESLLLARVAKKIEEAKKKIG